ncbi:MAG: hypothetical protein ACYTFQ_33145 [Planctomycetota bacterium]|jgi:hypothetical protein
MATRLISKTWKVEDVLTDVTTALLSDPTGAYGVKETVSGTVTVADGTAMTKSATGTYEYSFTDTEDIAYTAYVEFVYDGATYHFEVDIPARSAVGAMVASYSSLLERVGHHLFGIRSGYTSDQTTDIEECIKDGLHDVYTAHPWSFFRPVKEITTTAPYSTGTITVASGVVTLTSGTFPSWAAVGILEDRQRLLRRGYPRRRHADYTGGHVGYGGDGYHLRVGTTGIRHANWIRGCGRQGVGLRSRAIRLLSIRQTETRRSDPCMAAG